MVVVVVVVGWWRRRRRCPPPSPTAARRTCSERGCPSARPRLALTEGWGTLAWARRASAPTTATARESRPPVHLFRPCFWTWSASSSYGRSYWDFSVRLRRRPASATWTGRPSNSPSTGCSWRSWSDACRHHRLRRRRRRRRCRRRRRGAGAGSGSSTGVSGGGVFGVRSHSSVASRATRMWVVNTSRRRAMAEGAGNPKRGGDGTCLGALHSATVRRLGPMAKGATILRAAMSPAVTAARAPS